VIHDSIVLLGCHKHNPGRQIFLSDYLLD